MKVGIAQINPTVGDLSSNADIALKAYKNLVKKGVDLVVFPELAICGYPPRDLLFKKHFGEDCHKTLRKFARKTGPCPALIGFPQPSSEKGREPFFNAVALCVNGLATQIFQKRLLPTYDVFDEDRYFASGQAPLSFSHQGKKIAVTICEDMWNYDKDLHIIDPLDEIFNLQPDLLINLSASPWHHQKKNQRKRLLQRVVKKLKCPLVYVNAVGGNDELIFDGSSVALCDEGKIIGKAPSFEPSCLVFDLDSAAATMDEEAEDEMESIRQALVLGLRDYAHKSGFTRGIIGLSGGIDSAVTAALAVEALGKENVIGISLPSAISSGHSRDDARLLAENLGIEYHTLPIQKIVDSAEHELAPLFAGLDTDVTEENLQARSRGLLLMAVSNKLGALLLTTGNKSELAVGYCTLYGDMCGGLAVISDLPKTKVFQLARHINREREIIPNNSIEKPPSAELRPDQKDSDSLPDYQVLDGILEGYVEQGLSIHSLIELGFQEETVRKIVSLVDRNEYKRKQAAPGLKVTPLAFGIGRRMPIVQKYSN
jgi:NAD+ synthase (glutamine-hydrolysing)